MHSFYSKQVYIEEEKTNKAKQNVVFAKNEVVVTCIVCWLNDSSFK